jgi:hypothetical protein
MTTNDSGLQYEVYVDDNYHYMDESARYSGGVFDSWEAAEAKCRRIVDEFLLANYKEGMAADELLRAYKSYGEDPWILPPGRRPQVFSLGLRCGTLPGHLSRQERLISYWLR